MITADHLIGRRELGAERYVVVAQEPCGALCYSEMRVDHDWTERPLNRCECAADLHGKGGFAWSIGRGHYCVACGRSCDRTCVKGGPLAAA